jgi:hypothetical protein
MRSRVALIRPASLNAGTTIDRSHASDNGADGVLWRGADWTVVDDMTILSPTE